MIEDKNGDTFFFWYTLPFFAQLHFLKILVTYLVNKFEIMDDLTYLTMKLS